MATALKLRSDIKKLKKALDTKGISASIKDKLKSQLAKAENELASMKKGKKPTVSSTGGTKTALTKLQSLIKKKKFGVYQGQGVDLKKDADRPALPTGKRKSKSGNTYYEYRANRIDVKQPPKRFPKLEDGGMMADGGGVKNSSILQALSGFNQGQTLNGIAEILGFSNYRFGKYATESQMKSIERGLKENIKSGYVKEGGVGYKLTEKGATYLDTIPYEKREKGGYMADGGVMNDEKYKKRMKMFGYKPYGKTKGRYQIDYKIDGEKQTEIRTSFEEAQDAKKRYEKIGYTDVKITNVTDKMADGGELDKAVLKNINKDYDVYKNGKNQEHYTDFDDSEKVRNHIEEATGLKVLEIKELEIGKNYPDNDSNPYSYDTYEVKLSKGKSFIVERMYGRPRWTGNVAYTNAIRVKDLYKMAGGGNVSKSYEKIDGTNYELKIQVYYDKGGMNYFTSRPEARGYYLSVTPVQVERRENGIMIESYAAFSGIKALVLPVQRQSPKAEKQAEELAQKMMPELKEQVTSNLKRKLGMMAEGGSMEMRDVVTEEQQMAKGGQIDDLLAKQTEFLAQLTDIKLGADLETEEGVLNYRNQISPIREKLSVIEDELEMLGYEAYEKGGYMKKGGLTLGDISKKYDENEDINYHTENVVLLATHFGTADELRDAKTIKAKHDAIGHLPFNLYQERNELGDKLYQRMQEQIRENGMGAKPKKMAKGGYMAMGGEMHRYEKGGYMAEGGEVSKEDFLSKSIVYDNGGESLDRYTVYTPDGSVYGMSETGGGFNQYLGEADEIPQGKHLGKKLKSVPKEIEKAVLGRMEYEKGGYMAGGGKSQGYDDREDERLSMEHGKIADEDFVGTHSDMEHSRRDDARFEERMAEGGVLEHGLKKGDHIMVIKGNMLGIKNEITGDVVTLNIETGERKETKE